VQRDSTGILGSGPDQDGRPAFGRPPLYDSPPTSTNPRLPRSTRLYPPQPTPLPPPAAAPPSANHGGGSSGYREQSSRRAYERSSCTAAHQRTPSDAPAL